MPKKHQVVLMEKIEMRPTWTYELVQNLISIEKRRERFGSGNTGQLITRET